MNQLLIVLKKLPFISKLLFILEILIITNASFIFIVSEVNMYDIRTLLIDSTWIDANSSINSSIILLNRGETFEVSIHTSNISSIIVKIISKDESSLNFSNRVAFTSIDKTEHLITLPRSNYHHSVFLTVENMNNERITFFGNYKIKGINYDYLDLLIVAILIHCIFFILKNPVNKFVSTKIQRLNNNTFSRFKLLWAHYSKQDNEKGFFEFFITVTIIWIAIQPFFPTIILFARYDFSWLNILDKFENLLNNPLFASFLLIILFLAFDSVKIFVYREDNKDLMIFLTLPFKHSELYGYGCLYILTKYASIFFVIFAIKNFLLMNQYYLIYYTSFLVWFLFYFSIMISVLSFGFFMSIFAKNKVICFFLSLFAVFLTTVVDSSFIPNLNIGYKYHLITTFHLISIGISYNSSFRISNVSWGYRYHELVTVKNGFVMAIPNHSIIFLSIFLIFLINFCILLASILFKRYYSLLENEWIKFKELKLFNKVKNFR